MASIWCGWSVESGQCVRAFERMIKWVIIGLKEVLEGRDPCDAEQKVVAG